MAHPWQRTAAKYYEKSPPPPGGEPDRLQPDVVPRPEDLEGDEAPSMSYGLDTGWTDADMRVGPEVHNIEFYPGGKILPGGAGRSPAGGCYVDTDTGEIFEYEADRYEDKDTAGDWEATRIETTTQEYMPGQLLPADLAKKMGTSRAPKGQHVFKRGVHSNK
ncbi:hypothetical protein P9112_006440 [Eukaryota sp. TZLM1-RC]